MTADKSKSRERKPKTAPVQNGRDKTGLTRLKQAEKTEGKVKPGADYRRALRLAKNLEPRMRPTKDNPMLEPADNLTDLAAQIKVCTRCDLSKSRTQAVPGEGPANAQILFIGEAPGFYEDQQGRPFVGPSGQLLNELLNSIGMKREDVYIANVVKCFISPRVLIYTADGYKPIKDIHLGDLVLTHTGQFRRVCYIRPHETYPKGSPVIEFEVQTHGKGNSMRQKMTVTPEHPFMVNGQWIRAADLQVGDHLTALGDRCEVCGDAFFVHHSRYENRNYHVCSRQCHNHRIFFNDEVRQKITATLKQQYAEVKRDPQSITRRAHERTRELIAAGRAKIQNMSSEERRRGRIALAQNITAGHGKHRVGFGEEEMKAILDRIGVKYVHHFALPDSAYTYDFCLPTEKLLFEVRGPGFNFNRAIQERAMVKDQLADQHGYVVVNFWWGQIIEQPKMVEAMIRRLLKNHVGEYTFVDVVVTRVIQRETQRDFPLYNIGVEGDESYIADGIVSHNCRPPQNRDPQPDEMEACKIWLDRQIELIKPKVVITISRYAMARWFPNKKISEIHGKAQRFGDLVVVAMYHPAAALHQHSLRKVLEEDFKKLPDYIKNPGKVPSGSGGGSTSETPPAQLKMF